MPFHAERCYDSLERWMVNSQAPAIVIYLCTYLCVSFHRSSVKPLGQRYYANKTIARLKKFPFFANQDEYMKNAKFMHLKNLELYAM